MQRKSLFFIFLLNSLVSFSQNLDVDDEVFTRVDKIPQFPGGEEEMFNYLGRNVTYPKEAKSNDIQGVVHISFIVGKEGVIRDIKVAQSVHPILDEEALRVVSLMSKWNPGKNKGRPVSVMYILPIGFTVDEWSSIGNGDYHTANRFYEKKEYVKAIEYYSKSIIRKRKNNNDAYFKRAMCYWELGGKEKACIDWKQGKKYGDKRAKEMLKKHCNK